MYVIKYLVWLKKISDKADVLSTQYHYRLYFVTVLVIDRLRRRRSFVRMAALNTGSFLSQI